MSTAARDELRRLHLINSLFSRVTGNDLYLANQIKDAIAFSLAELETQTLARPELAAQYDAAFTASAARLLATYYADQPAHGFHHWDATHSLTAATPLFARSELMTGLKRLAPFREATLLITNLRPALLPPEKRATPKRTREYEDTLAFIQELAAARTPTSTQLQLLFL